MTYLDIYICIYIYCYTVIPSKHQHYGVRYFAVVELMMSVGLTKPKFQPTKNGDRVVAN